MIEQVLAKLNSVPADKVAHFASGVILFALLSWINPYLAFRGVVFAGKEIYDSFHREDHTPDLWDGFATVLGGVVGMFIKFI